MLWGGGESSFKISALIPGRGVRVMMEFLMVGGGGKLF
jgi:hypothetical protein